MITEGIQAETVIGRYCRLQRPVRDRAGKVHFEERPRILREVTNLGRMMYLVEFVDGATTFVFPDEVAIQ